MTLSVPEFNYVRRLVLDQSAIVLEEDKGYLVESRLLPLARREGFASINLLVQRMQAEPFHGLHRRAVEAMTTNETSFFRDFHPFEGLKKVRASGSDRPASGGKRAEHLVCCQLFRAGTLQPRHADAREFPPVIELEDSHSGH